MNDGPYMLVHQVTGTYLETDNYNDNVGEAVQTWNLDPLQTTKGFLGHKWLLHKNPDESFLIKSFENQRCLTASATSASDYPRLQDSDDGNARQHWLFERVSDDPDTYAIIPKLYPGYALGIQSNVVGNDAYVVPTRTWGKPTFFHYWRLTHLTD
jgi:hypothetical protein